MLTYPRRAIDLSLSIPDASGKAAFYSANVRAKVRRGVVRQCWISEAQLARVRVELDAPALDEGGFIAHDIDGFYWRVIVDRPRKRY